MTSTHVLPKNRRVVIERTMHIIECAHCSVDFGIGDDFMRRRREDHGDFYCPNGHANVYRADNEAERLATELARTKRQLGYAESRATAAQDQARAAEYARRGQKAANTKLKKRIAAGVCPCCNRTFQNLGRHMQGQHPTFVAEVSA